MTLPAGDIYTDFSGFASLRAQARNGEDAARAKVAEQVEGMFMSLMLKSMREAGQAFGDTVGGVEQGMYDSQLAVELTKGSKLGFAQTMFGTPRQNVATIDGAASFPAPARNISIPARDWIAVRAAINDAPVESAAGAHELDAGAVGSSSSPRVDPTSWVSPQDFAQQLWPAASRAAKQLGTSPEAVLAVAALETGWGKHMPRNANGTLSNNLFGIKAHGWSGDVTRSPTLEFENGAFARRIEPFRAYASAEDAIADFANFVTSQPRYEQALQSNGDPVKFVRALHAAGYATDPRYGDKLAALVNNPVIKQAAIVRAANPAAMGTSEQPTT